MAEFLAEDNVCGQNLLQLVAVGNAIVAELLRLKDHIPDVFWLRKVDGSKTNKYADIIFDFSYFEKSDALDQRIEKDLDLDNLDKRFRDSYLEIVKRFYLAFESIHQYVVDLNAFIDELNDGIYIQQTIETVFQDAEGRQMLIESLYLYGVMLLVIDLHIPGIIRERLLVSYHRYSAQSHGDSNIDDVCKLLRSTGFSGNGGGGGGGKRIANYPEDYFRRISLNEQFIEMVIGHLRSDDVYHQIPVYPLPEHRTTALANQAGMLYVCLYFSPGTLHRGNAGMREIVDKFFPDNWIVSFYMGITVDLIDAWDPYRAAKQALANTIAAENIKEVCNRHAKNLEKSLRKAQSVLKDINEFTEEQLAKNITNMLNLLRRCNVTMRWFMLHTATACIMSFAAASKERKSLHKLVLKESAFKEIQIFDMLLTVSQLEVRVRDIIRQLLTEKQERWLQFRAAAVERIDELSQAFSGVKPMLKMVANQQLHQWLTEISREISQLSYDTPSISERKVIQLIKALDEVQTFHNLDANMQVKQHLTESRQYLHQMIETRNIKEETLINIQIIGDLSYAWICVNNYTECMQHSISKPPYLVINLRAIFLKLASALEIPLLRINQAHSGDLESVSQYFSMELVKYVRQVVGIIPRNIFRLITEYIYNETKVIKKMPARIEKSMLKEYAQLDQRKLIASFTMKISALTEGILTMQTTLVGVIELDPKRLLVDGIKRELNRHLSEALEGNFAFNGSNDAGQMDAKLNEVVQRLDRYRWSFDYIQDYLHINGSKIFEEEMSKIINFNMENECNLFQSEHKPLVNGQPTNHVTEPSVNFIGRFAKEILRLTDPGSTIYIELNRLWLAIAKNNTRSERFNMKIFAKIINSIGPIFLAALDRFYAHIIHADIQDFLLIFDRAILQDKQTAEMLNGLRDTATAHSSNIPQGGHQFYLRHTNKFTKKSLSKFQHWIMEIGRIQILRKEIAFDLNKSCKFYSKHLESSLRTMNDALLMELKMAATNVDGVEAKTPSTEMLCELNGYLECAGIYNPYHKIYVTTTKSQSLYCVVFLFVIVVQSLARIRHPKMVRWPNGTGEDEDIDGVTFIVGVTTIMRQFHRDIVHLFIEYMSQYIVTYVNYNLRTDSMEIRCEAGRALDMLQMILEILGIASDVLEKYIPEAMQLQFPYLSIRFSDTSYTAEEIGFIPPEKK